MLKRRNFMVTPVNCGHTFQVSNGLDPSPIWKPAVSHRRSTSTLPQSIMGAAAVAAHHRVSGQWMTWSPVSTAPATPAPVTCTHMWALCPAVRNTRRAARGWRRRRGRRRHVKGRASAECGNMSQNPLCSVPCPPSAWPIWLSLCLVLKRLGHCQPPLCWPALHLWPQHLVAVSQSWMLLQENPSRTKRHYGEVRML